MNHNINPRIFFSFLFAQPYNNNKHLLFISKTQRHTKKAKDEEAKKKAKKRERNNCLTLPVLSSILLSICNGSE